MNISRFITYIFLFFTIVLYSFFTYYFLKQEEKLSGVILKNLNSSLSETSYLLSKSGNKFSDIYQNRAILDRITANDYFIKSIYVSYNDLILVSTDPHSKGQNIRVLNKKCDSALEELIERKILEQDFYFYSNAEKLEFKVGYILDKENIKASLSRNQKDGFIYFGVLPIFLLLVVLYLLRKYISKPLEELRKFVYYNDVVPKKFALGELESIRYSTIQTFSRLDTEKKELYLMARTDSLSGLANRNSLEEYLEKLIASSLRNKNEFAFLFLDLDHFKSVNDSLGHNIGDELLKNVADLVQHVVRPSDMVARIGGDEFVIVISEYDSYIELCHIIDRIQQQLLREWVIQTHPIRISSSVGIAIYPKDGTDMIDLMKNSDIAMYQAKKLGRAQYYFFTNDLNDEVQSLIKLDNDLKDALKNNEFQLYYQAKVDVNSNKIVGVEALIRWIKSNGEMISPNNFIPMAEENGFIIEIGNWVVDEAIRQQVEWRDKGVDIKISINVSAKQIMSKGFSDALIDKLEKNKVDASKIDVEITEYMLISENTEALDVLVKLYHYGITISLDDFGTGYSSLSYLKKFPIDYLKIDKAFLDDYKEEEGKVFLQTIVKMAESLKITVIAEGVEEKEQVEYLQSIGCKEYQGYYFSKPIKIEDFEVLYFKHKGK